MKVKEVSYKAGGIQRKGYLAYDPLVLGKRPRVLVMHEWWGHNDYARKRVQMLAQMGDTALAVDMYGEGKQAAHPTEAGQFAQLVLQESGDGQAAVSGRNASFEKSFYRRFRKNCSHWILFWRSGIILNMARMGVDLKGVASFHGSLDIETPAQKGVTQAKVLVLHGAADSFIPEEDTQAFKKEMEQAGVD